MLQLTPLIPILINTFNNEEINSVSAKELHKALEIKKDFSDWIKKQIERAELSENIDFIVFSQKGENPKGGRPEQKYILTIESAKHIAMMSQSKKAKEVRDYFIETEKNYINLLKQKALPTTTTTITITASLTDELFRQNEQLLQDGIISRKLTSNEIRVLSVLIQLQEQSTQKYIVITNVLIGKKTSISVAGVANIFTNLYATKAITRLFRRNQEGTQERRIFISEKLLAKLNLQQPTIQYVPSPSLPVIVEKKEEPSLPLSLREQKIERLEFALGRAKDFIVEDPDYAPQYKENIRNLKLHLAQLRTTA